MKARRDKTCKLTILLDWQIDWLECEFYREWEVNLIANGIHDGKICSIVLASDM